MSNPEQTNFAFLRLSKRAESSDRAKLIETFVDVGPLFTLISSSDHQVLYGRRGTGKTHALMYLADRAAANGDVPVYLDLRTIGSSGGIYGDISIALTERATRLAIDTLLAVHNSIYNHVLQEGVNLNLAVIGPILDELADSVTEINIVGTVQREESALERGSTSTNRRAGVDISPQAASAAASTARSSERTNEESSRLIESGTAQHRVHFGSVGYTLRKLLDAFDGRRLWLLLDEWSAIPIELQPYLADLLRRSVLPSKGVVVKIGAIEQRTNFQLPGPKGDYVGIELGADVSVDLNLDDFMVFDNNADRATTFFQELLYKHYRAAAQELGQTEIIGSSQELVGIAFTQRNVFSEFVRAAEGVPRDAINIISLAAQRALTNAISTEHIRTSAKMWYSRDKEAAVSANATAGEFLHWIIDEVIAHRRARAFLLASSSRHELIDALFDARVLHLLKRNIAAHDQPGIRFDVYKIDYGCYVDLLTTAKAPQGLLPAGDEGEDASAYVDVPPDDYRAIRRAILDPAKFHPRGTAQ